MTNGGGIGEAALYRRVGLRLVPFLFVCYLFNYIDRVNVGFAKLRMLDDLGFSETVYGFGAGVFFVGYLACGVPSNLVLQRIGARRWVAAMMIAWGLCSAALMTVRTAEGFYALRLLTGAAEAGFFPGIVLYLTRWFPPDRHGRVMSLFMAAIPLSGAIGGPMSGWMLSRFAAAPLGLASWQWLFLLQGLPTVILGVAVLFVLPDDVGRAGWLTAAEKALLLSHRGSAAIGDTPAAATGRVLRTRAVWVLGLVYFCVMSGVNAISFWLPTIIAGTGEADPLAIGLLSAVPYLAAVLLMTGLGRSADRRGERRLHLALPLALGAAGLGLAAIASGSTAAALFGMTLAAAGAITAIPMFWSYAGPDLGATGGAAAALAFVNTLGQVSGFASPYFVGWMKDMTGGTEVALACLSGVVLLGVAIVLLRRATRG